MTQSFSFCVGCTQSRERGRTTCFWCGTALGLGREPSADERFATSPEGRQARIEQSMSSRRESDEIDACVAAAIAGRLRVGAEFTHDELVEPSGLNTCAIKFALERLATRGVVRQAGRVQVRSQRFRTIWRVVVPGDAAATGTGASAPTGDSADGGASGDTANAANAGAADPPAPAPRRRARTAPAARARA
ncbi:MAG TPA: hypothetical protein VEL07_21540 [Planctomycetota bacterium]|nr:hypothetical protein [Planctomycetota bacterium]